MKKVVCIESYKNHLGEVVKGNIYHVLDEIYFSNARAYVLVELGPFIVCNAKLFRDYEEPPVLVTWEKLVETYPVHAN